MTKKEKEELVNKTIDEATELSKYLIDMLEKRLEEHSATPGDILVGLGMFTSMILANIYEQCEGMTSEKAIQETHRWTSIVVSEVSDYFANKK